MPTSIATILTHPGSAHKDEFLAWAVLLAVHPALIVSRNVTQIMKYGLTAAQTAAQPLRAGGDTVTCGDVDWSKDEVLQAYAALKLKGLTLTGIPAVPLHPMVRFGD